MSCHAGHRNALCAPDNVRAHYRGVRKPSLRICPLDPDAASIANLALGDQVQGTPPTQPVLTAKLVEHHLSRKSFGTSSGVVLYIFSLRPKRRHFLKWKRLIPLPTVLFEAVSATSSPTWRKPRAR